MGFAYANALVLVLFDGLLFVVLTITGLRKMIFEAIPKPVKAAISAGIGLFIAFLGLQNAGIVVDSGDTLVDMHSFNIVFNKTTWAELMPIIVAILAILMIAVMYKRKLKGAICAVLRSDRCFDPRMCDGCGIGLRRYFDDQRRKGYRLGRSVNGGSRILDDGNDAVYL